MNFLIDLRFDSKDGCMGHQLDGDKKLGEVYCQFFFLSLVFLFCAQWIIARVRCHFPQSLKWLDNTPLLLMEDGKFNEINMKKANVSENDILAKLREANAYDLNKVHAVIFETTGGISVLHGDNFTKNKNFILKDVQHSKL